MPTTHTLTVVLFVLLALLVVVQLVRFLLKRRRLLRNRIAEQPPIYAVGSPEDNARIVATIYTLNQRLARRGKRIPERVAMDLIQRSTEAEGAPDD